MAALEVVVIGPGAIGCTFGAALVQAGHRVLFAGRTPFDRIAVNHQAGEVDAEITFVTSAKSLRPVDTVVLATKAHQVPEVAELLRASCRPDTIIAVLQNGIDHESRVRPILDTHPVHRVEVIPAMVACPADRTSPGCVTVNGPAILEVPLTSAGRFFAEAFNGSFANVRPVQDIHTSLWRKLILNAVGGGIGVLTRRSNELFVSHPEALALARGLAAEVLAVARADGAQLGEDTVDGLISMLQRGSTHLPSIVVDRINGQPTEWRIRNQIVVEKGKQHGIATPLNELLTDLIRFGEPVLAKSGEPPERRPGQR